MNETILDYINLDLLINNYLKESDFVRKTENTWVHSKHNVTIIFNGDSIIFKSKLFSLDIKTPYGKKYIHLMKIINFYNDLVGDKGAL